jgi:hypothetical protein
MLQQEVNLIDGVAWHPKQLPGTAYRCSSSIYEMEVKPWQESNQSNGVILAYM